MLFAFDVIFDWIEPELGVTFVDGVNLSPWFDLHIPLGQDEFTNGLQRKMEDVVATTLYVVGDIAKVT